MRARLFGSIIAATLLVVAAQASALITLQSIKCLSETVKHITTRRKRESMRTVLCTPSIPCWQCTLQLKHSISSR